MKKHVLVKKIFTNESKRQYIEWKRTDSPG